MSVSISRMSPHARAPHVSPLWPVLCPLASRLCRLVAESKGRSSIDGTDPAGQLDTGQDWTGLSRSQDWTGLDWVGLAWLQGEDETDHCTHPCGGAAESNGEKVFYVFPSISFLGDDGRSYFVCMYCTAALSWTMKKKKWIKLLQLKLVGLTRRSPVAWHSTIFYCGTVLSSSMVARFRPC